MLEFDYKNSYIRWRRRRRRSRSRGQRKRRRLLTIAHSHTDSLCINVHVCRYAHIRIWRTQSDLYFALNFSFRALISCSQRAQLLGRNHRKIDSNWELKKSKINKRKAPDRSLEVVVNFCNNYNDNLRFITDSTCAISSVECIEHAK